MQRYTSRAAALVAARSVLGFGRLVGMPSPALFSAVMFPAGSWRLASDVEGGSEQSNPNRPSAVAWVGGAAGKNVPEAGRKKAARAPHVSSTCGATIEEQQALWLALACIVMRPRVRNDELKQTLGDAAKLSMLITTAMRSMNGEFDNKDLVARQIEVAERDINGVNIRDVAALKTFFASRRAPSALFDAPLPSTAEPYRSLEVEDTSIAWTLDDAISCGNEFVRVTGNQMQCAFLIRTELWETSTRANTYTQYYVQTEPVDLAVVIDDVGRYPRSCGASSASAVKSTRPSKTSSTFASSLCCAAAQVRSSSWIRRELFFSPARTRLALSACWSRQGPGRASTSRTPSSTSRRRQGPCRRAFRRRETPFRSVC
jgi:hypothetical protein